MIYLHHNELTQESIL